MVFNQGAQECLGFTPQETSLQLNLVAATQTVPVTTHHIGWGI
jgi:hypothetical protein